MTMIESRIERRCCREAGPFVARPGRSDDQARTQTGLPVWIIRLSTLTPIATSPC
jgi:hypothetical protein